MQLFLLLLIIISILIFSVLSIYILIKYWLFIRNNKKYKLIYSKDKDEIPLHYYNENNQILLTGNPDLIYEHGENLIIIERRPFDKYNHEPLKLLMYSYFLCAEQEFNKRVLYAEIKDIKNNKSIKVLNNNSKLTELERVFFKLKLIKSNSLKPSRTHNNKQRCFYCKKKKCSEALYGIE